MKILRYILGKSGTNWTNGTNGTNGVDGKSAYQTWIEIGNTGSQEDFIQALVWQPWSPGTDGTDGVDWQSAYELWLGQGNSGTIQDFLDSLVGPAGADAVIADWSITTIKLANGAVTDEKINSVSGSKVGSGINASNISSGVIHTARLPTDVVKTVGNYTISGQKIFSQFGLQDWAWISVNGGIRYMSTNFFQGYYGGAWRYFITGNRIGSHFRLNTTTGKVQYNDGYGTWTDLPEVAA